MPSPLLGLAVPGEGPADQALAIAQQLCLQMNEWQPACMRVHSRLRNLLAELQSMEQEDQLPSSSLLGQYVAVLTRFVRFLQLNHDTSLLCRVVRHRPLVEDLEQLHKSVALLFVELLDVDVAIWDKQWGEDCFEQAAVLTASLSDAKVLFRDLQSPRAQLEALLTLKFEVEKRNGRHEEADLIRMESLIETIRAALQVSCVTLPPWYTPEYEMEVQANPFARGDVGSVHYADRYLGPKVVVKRFCVDDSVVDESMWMRIGKEVDALFALEHPNIMQMYCASHVSSPPFLVSANAENGNLRCFLARSDDNKKKMWQLLYEAAVGLDYVHKKGVVHGNLKLSNILVDATMRSKLSDFGLTTLRMCCTLSKPSAGKPSSGSMRWQAPECFRQLPTFASDVFSFGMCIIEAVSGAPPFGLLSDDEYRANLRNGSYCDKPDGMPYDLWGFVLLMTNRDPTKRIDLQLVDKLKEIAARSAVVGASTCACSKEICANSRFCSQCGERCTQHELGSQSLSQESTPPELTSDNRISDLLNAVPIGNIDSQEQALLTVYLAGFSDGKLLYDGNGILELANLVKHGRTYFIRVCALDCLRRAELNSKVAPRDFEVYRGLVGPATSRECRSVVTALWQGDNLGKTKALVHCACISEKSISALRETGVAVPLVALLTNGDANQKLCAAYALGRLANAIGNCEIIGRAGAINPLLALLRAGSNVQKEQSAWALSRLSSSDDCCTRIITNDGAISLFIELLRSGSASGKLHGACALGNAAVNSEDARLLIVIHGAIVPFVALLHSESDQLRDQAVQTLANLAVDKVNGIQILREEGLLPLVNVLRDGTDYQKGQAARGLANLAIDATNIDAITRAGAIPSLVNILRGRCDKKDEATRALANLAFKFDSRRAIINAGAIEPLVEQLQREHDSFMRPPVAIRALANLALNAESRNSIVNSGAVCHFVALLHDGSDLQKSHAARALANLAAEREHHSEIIRVGAIPALVTLLSCEVDNVKEKAAVAFANLSMDSASRGEIANAGAIVPLVALLRDGTERQTEHALRVLADMALDKRNLCTLKGVVAIPRVVVLLRSGTDKQKYQIARLLGNLVAIDEFGSDIIYSSVIIPLVRLLQDGTHDQKSKSARALAKMARNYTYR
ncbi:hypothetical protein PHYPSEUDO_009168 [Phytophthora pseudosyringae]|uniref:Protein kinase domain-containing protein n=1 Tax=Phytophthora pseudosyringae TaxID=221518 RepID=A0A8T1VCG5_9STRA|nr:hypothetical protein PHYPSEUDO_009168 [Phytophthora pseudosyringae]